MHNWRWRWGNQTFQTSCGDDELEMFHIRLHLFLFKTQIWSNSKFLHFFVTLYCQASFKRFVWNGVLIVDWILSEHASYSQGNIKWSVIVINRNIKIFMQSDSYGVSIVMIIHLTWFYKLSLVFYNVEHSFILMVF